MSHHQRARKDINTTSNCRLTKPLSDPEADFKPTPFIDAWDAYAREKGNPRLHIDRRLLEKIGAIFVHQIDQDFVDRAATEIWPSAPAQTRNRLCYTPISAVTKFSAKRGWCAYWRLRRPKQLRKDPPPLPSTADLRKFVNGCQPHLKHIVIFLVRTGADVSETLYLYWADVDMIRRTARLRSGTGRTRVISLDEMAVTRLQQTPSALRTGNVFLTNHGKPYSPKRSGGGQLKSALASAWKNTGVKITLSTLKRIWRARRRGERLEGEVDTEEQKNIVSEPMSSQLTKHREYS